MASPVINPTPKSRFMGSAQSVRNHRNLMQSEELQQSLDFALMQYQHELSKTQQDQFNAAAACHFRMQGAIDFIHQLKHLAESVTLPTVVNRDNLDHTTH